ncbi:MAG: 4-oxalomesaconate tautomerase, partial [Deltaproteobacteria bacterium]
MQTAIPACLMRGGTSKGLIFLAEDLPNEPSLRDQVLLAAMGSPDARQIDGVGGAHPLTSKVGVISKSTRPDADVDYLFLQVVVDKAEVSDSQNCGNILAAVGPFALEKGLLEPKGDLTEVRIHMVNTANLAIAQVQTPGGEVNYEGEARIDGVPGTAAPVLLDFLDTAGSSCGALLPTGRACDEIDGLQVTCIDNGMPVVLIAAKDLGKTGYESPAELEADSQLKSRVESIRLQAGALMNLGDVTTKTVPKMSLVAPAQQGGVIATRTFIPHRVHEAIGVLGAGSVA